MFLSYLVTCKNDENDLKNLLDILYAYSEDAECVILDDHSDNPKTLDILGNAEKKSDFFRVIKHNLNNNYGEHKNYGKSHCKGEWIFQIDSDEIPSEVLLTNLRGIIESNSVELIWIPRINDFKGVTPEHARQWNWRLTPYDGRYIINFPDFQSRAFRNLPHIEWKRKLHEKVEGAKTYAFLPAEYEYSLIHNKTIEKQIETNLRYNKDFSDADNKGFKVYTKH